MTRYTIFVFALITTLQTGWTTEAIRDSAVCAICQAGDEQVADTAFYNGQVYYFCSLECKAEFVANPELYAKAPEPVPEWMATVPS